MRARGIASSIVALFMVAACVGPASGPEAARGMGPCLPPGVSAQFFFWPVVGVRTINLFTEDGDLAPTSWVLYRRGKTAIAAMWVQSELIAVDPDPETDAPEWVDLSLVTPVEGKLVLRRQPEAPCRWERWDTGTNASLPSS